MIHAEAPNLLVVISNQRANYCLTLNIPVELTHRFELFEIRRGGVLSLDQWLSAVENRAHHHAEGEHIAEDAAVGVDLVLGSCSGGECNRLIN